MRKLLYLICAANLACNPAARREVPPEESVSIDVQNEHLEDLIIDFLKASSEGSPGKVDSLRTEIAQYADLGDLPEEVALKVRRNGLTFVMPLRFLYLQPDSNSAWSGGPAVLSTPLRGEPLDLCANDDGQNFYLLFPDSLVEIGVEGEPLTYRFPPASIRKQKPRFANGSISGQLMQERRLLLMTSSLDGPLIFDQSRGVLRQAQHIDFSDRGAVMRWYFPRSRNVFVSLDQSFPLRTLLALRHLSGTSEAVIDENGFLRLIVADQMTWASERAWGKRLFRMGANLVAVCNDRENVFVLFERVGNSFAFAGRSPEFPGKVKAIAAIQTNDRSGFAVATANDEICQVYWADNTEIHWSSEGGFSVPQFPDERARVRVINAIEAETGSTMTAQTGARLRLSDDTPVMSLGGELVNNWIFSLRSDSSFQSWDMTLRQPLLLSDGTQLTAKQVAESWLANWQTCFDHECPERWLWLVIAGAPDYVQGAAESVAGLKIIDETHLRIQLTEPRPLFREHLAHGCFAIFRPYDSGSPTTSSFVVEDTAPATKHLIPNVYYRHGEPALAQITLGDASRDEIIATFQDRPFITLLRDRQTIDYFRQLPGIRVEPFPTPSIYFVAFNGFREPFSDVQLRRYVAARLAKPEELQQIVTAGVCAIRDSLFSGKVDHAPPDEGVSWSNATDVEIIFRLEDTIARQIAERLTARLRQAGMTVAGAKGQQSHQWKRRMKTGDYSLLVTSFEPDHEAPVYNLASLIYDGYNVDSDILLKLTAGLQGDVEASREIEHSLLGNVILLPLLEARNYLVYPDNIQDVGLQGAATLDLSRAWIPLTRSNDARKN